MTSGVFRISERGEKVPPPQKIFEIFAWKWRILVAFLPYARFFAQFKARGAWPKWPNGKYAYAYDCNAYFENFAEQKVDLVWIRR